MLIYHAPIELVNSRKICWSSLSLTSLSRSTAAEATEDSTYNVRDAFASKYYTELRALAVECNQKKCTTSNTFAILSGNRPIKLCNKVNVWISLWPKKNCDEYANMEQMERCDLLIRDYYVLLHCFYWHNTNWKKKKRWSTTAKEHYPNHERDIGDGRKGNPWTDNASTFPGISWWLQGRISLSGSKSSIVLV